MPSCRRGRQDKLNTRGRADSCYPLTTRTSTVFLRANTSTEAWGPGDSEGAGATADAVPRPRPWAGRERGACRRAGPGRGRRRSPGPERDGPVRRRPGPGARAVEEAGQPRGRLRDRGAGENLPGLPLHQDLLPAPGPEPRLRPGQSPRSEAGGRADPRRAPPGRPAGGPGDPGRPARARAEGGPRQLPAPEPLPVGDPRAALPRGLQPRHARLVGQVSGLRGLGAPLQVRLTRPRSRARR